MSEYDEAFKSVVRLIGLLVRLRTSESLDVVTMWRIVDDVKKSKFVTTYYRGHNAIK